MSENADGFIDGLLNEIAERVIKKISENTSNWLNTVQYKVKAENIEGLIKTKQIKDFEQEVGDITESALNDLGHNMRETATEAAEEVIKNATFTVDVGL